MLPIQQASLQTRGQSWFAALPFGTRAVLLTCCGVYVTCILLGYDAYSQVCLAPKWVLYHGRV
jgi:hypothetical protein